MFAGRVVGIIRWLWLVLEVLEEREQGVGRPVATGAGAVGLDPGEGLFLDRHVGVQVGLGGSSWPIQSAMTEVSTPACNSAIAAEWRRVCGVTFLAAMVGRLAAAVVACFVTSFSTASRDSGRPTRVGNSGSVPAPVCSASQTRSTATVCLVSGLVRSLRPLPWQRTCAPTPR
jgi:hypothetical protein